MVSMVESFKLERLLEFLNNNLDGLWYKIYMDPKQNLSVMYIEISGRDGIYTGLLDEIGVFVYVHYVEMIDKNTVRLMCEPWSLHKQNERKQNAK